MKVVSIRPANFSSQPPVYRYEADDEDCHASKEKHEAGSAHGLPKALHFRK